MKKWWMNFYSIFGEGYFKQFTNSTDTEVAIIAQTLRANKIKNILDLGCGVGRHSMGLAAFGFSVVGVDYSKEYIEIAQQKSKQSPTTAHFIKSSYQSYLPKCSPQSMECIISVNNSMGYLERRSGDITLFKQISRALKPQGLFIFSFLNDSILKSIEAYPNHRKIDRVNSKIDFYSTPGHPTKVAKKPIYSLRYYNTKELEEIFESLSLIRDKSFDGKRLCTSPFESVYLFRKTSL